MRLFCHRIDRSPIGALSIIHSVSPFVIYRIFLPNTPFHKAAACLEASGCLPSRSRESLELEERILGYLHGASTGPGPVPWDQLWLKELTPLQINVLEATSRIPFGTCVSYGRIAEEINRPKACRFVGSALAGNPFPLLIPCHRVIRSDGSYGKFGGGSELKRYLITMEAEIKGTFS